MGIHSNSSIEGNINILYNFNIDNWSQNNLLQTNFPDYMSYDKFLLISKFLHFNDNEKPENEFDKLSSNLKLLPHLYVYTCKVIYYVY